MHNLWKSSPFVLISSFLALLLTSNLSAEFLKGKFELAPTYIHVDVLESGHTRHRMDLPAIRGEATLMTEKTWGLCLKPVVLYGANNGELFSGNIGLGHYTPLNDWFAVTPVVGYIYSNLHTNTIIEIPFLGDVKAKERFRSNSVFVSLEFTVKFSDTCRAGGAYQYSWSRSHTNITFAAPIPVLTSSDKTEGPSYSLYVEKDITPKWSVNLGAAYNIGLSHEKHGLRAYGAKLGIAYWL